MRALLLAAVALWPMAAFAGQVSGGATGGVTPSQIGSTPFAATGATAARASAARAADAVNVKDYGAKGDTVLLQQNVYALANGYPTNQIVLSNGGATASMVGATAIIAGAGAPGAGSHLRTTVSTVTDSTHVVLATAASATGSFTGQIMVGYHALTSTFSFTAGSTTLTASSAVFNSGMLNQGIILPGAGIAPFLCKITSVPSASAINCAATPTTAVNNASQVVPVGTDDTAAIQAAYTAAEAKTTPAVYFPDGRYLTTASLNLTGYTNGSTSGTGTIYGAVADLPVVDQLSARYTRWTGVNIVGDPSVLPIAGLAVGRISGASADNHRFSNFTINGGFGLTALEDVGAESTPFIGVQFANSIGPFTAVLDGIHHFTDASAYVTQSQTVDAPNSFNEAVFTADLFSGSSTTGAPIWMAATGKTRFDASSYLASASPQAVILYGVTSANISLPVFDLHMEPTSLTYDYVLDGPASPSITNMQWRDHNIQATTAAFHIDPNAGFGTQILNDVDFVLGVNSTVTPKLFDTPANWSVSGMIHAPSSLFNLGTATFSGCYWPVYGAPTCDNMTFDGATTAKAQFVANQGVKVGGTTPIQLGDATSGGWTTLSGDGTGKVSPYRFNSAGSYQANSLDLVGSITATAAGSRIAGGIVSSLTGTQTLTSAQCGTMLATGDAAAVTYTVPTGLPLGCQIDVEQGAAGAVTFAAGSGETIHQAGTGTLTHATTGQYAKATVKIDSASTFLLGGQVQ